MDWKSTVLLFYLIAATVRNTAGGGFSSQLEILSRSV
jgi:hypothetical protein